LEPFHDDFANSPIRAEEAEIERGYRTTKRINMRKKKSQSFKTKKLSPEHGLFEIASNSRFKNQGEIHCPSGKEFMHKVGETGLNRR
jgi:hypothetical protein